MADESRGDQAVKWGAIGGFFYVIITYLFYLIVKDARPVTLPYSLIPYGAPIAFMIIAALLKKSNQGGYLSFKEAVSIMFKVMLLSLLFYAIFEYTLFNRIAPTLNVSLRELTIQNSAMMMKKMGYSAELIAEQQQPYQQDDFKITVQRELMQTVFSIIKSFILIVLVAALIQRKKATT